MLKLELAGVTIRYENAVDLQAKVARATREKRERRAELERDLKMTRRQERQLMKFIGAGRGSERDGSEKDVSGKEGDSNE